MGGFWAGYRHVPHHVEVMTTLLFFFISGIGARRLNGQQHDFQT
jgi:hypothetical protein